MYSFKKIDRSHLFFFQTQNLCINYNLINTGRSELELRDKLQDLSKNENKLNIYALFYEYHLIWFDLYSKHNHLLATFFSTPHGAVKFLNICKALCKKSEMLRVLEYANQKQDSLPMTNLISYELYRNWLWLAITELNEKLVPYYINKYKNIYNIMAKSVSTQAENYEFFFPRAQIEENLAYAILQFPAPHKSIPAKTGRHYSNTSNLHLYVQAFLHKENNSAITGSDYRNLTNNLLSIKKVSGARIISPTVSFFITCGLYKQLYRLLENMFNTLENKKEILPGSTDLEWIQNNKRFLIPITEWLVRLGLVFNKKREVIAGYIERSKRILYTQYSYEDSDGQMQVVKMIKDNDTRLDNLDVLIGHNFKPNDFMEAPKSKSGMDMLLNARNLMNPHNPQFSPKSALDLLKCAMNNTNQYGDIYLEYIRCNLLLDFNYSSQHDKILKEYFFRCSEHIGFLWIYFAKCPRAYNNDLVLLLTLEKHVKNHVFKLLEAYQHPNDSEILIKYPIHLFQTALGRPQDFLNFINIRLEAYQKPIAHPSLGRPQNVHSEEDQKSIALTSNYSWNYFLRLSQKGTLPVKIGGEKINTDWEFTSAALSKYATT